MTELTNEQLSRIEAALAKRAVDYAAQTALPFNATVKLTPSIHKQFWATRNGGSTPVVHVDPDVFFETDGLTIVRRLVALALTFEARDRLERTRSAAEREYESAIAPFRALRDRRIAEAQAEYDRTMRQVD